MHRAAGSSRPNGATVPSTNRQIISQSDLLTAIQQIEDGFNGLTTGMIGNGPLHRGPLSTRYGFREGKLRSLAITGGISWRGSSKAGSRDARLKFQNAGTLTTAQNVEAAYDYLWVPSQLTNNVGANYTRRFGRYNARFQLNITNVLNDDDPQ